jgi:hypothetical protein
MLIFVFTKNISDISQKHPVRLLTLNLLPFIMPAFTLTTVSESTRFGFVHTQEYVCVLSKGSMFVHDLFFIYLHAQVEVI